MGWVLVVVCEDGEIWEVEKRVFKDRRERFGIWHLAFGIWAFGIGHLALGIWHLCFGFCGAGTARLRSVVSSADGL